MEILRRLLFVFGLLGGVWAWFDGPPVLVSLAVADFARDKAEAEKRPTGFIYRDDSLEEFFHRRTDDRRLRVDGPKWAAFHAAVRAATEKGEGDGELLARRGRDDYRDRLYYLPGEPPVAEVADSLGESRPLVYLAVGGEGPAAPTLTLDRVDSSDAAGRAPLRLRRPHRNWAAWLALAGFSCYLLLPRRRHSPETIRYARPSAIVLPDLLGTGLLLLFFGLPFMVAATNRGSLFDLDEPWWILGVVCGLLCLGPLAILFVSTRNASFWAETKEDALVIHRWARSRKIPFKEFEVLRGIQWRTPPWVRLLGGLLTRVNWRA
ncbi:MAG: hypothetical protein ACE5H3_11385, partial [Planctomycetota bacterium]